MATLRATIKSALSGDATLTALLTGGVKDASDDGRNGLALEDLLDTDGITIKPTAVIRWRATGELQPQAYLIGAESQDLEIYLYANLIPTTLESAISRIKVLLHNKYWSCDDRTLAHTLFGSGSGEFRAEEYNNCPAQFVRYSCNFVRK